MEQPIHRFLPLPSAIFQATTQLHLLKTLYLLEQRTNCSRCLSQSSRELNFFPVTEFCKDQNKWESEGAVSGEYGSGIGISQPGCDSFCLTIRETCGLELS